MVFTSAYFTKELHMASRPNSQRWWDRGCELRHHVGGTSWLVTKCSHHTQWLWATRWRQLLCWIVIGLSPAVKCTKWEGVQMSQSFSEPMLQCSHTPDWIKSDHNDFIRVTEKCCGNHAAIAPCDFQSALQVKPVCYNKMWNTLQ